MKKLCTILFLFLALASRATDVSFDFKNLAGGADYFRLSTSTNRLEITPLEAPFICNGQLIGSDPMYYLPSTNGTGTMTNLCPSRYLAKIRIKSKETSFQFVVTNSTDVVPLYGLTSITTNATPQTANAFSMASSDARYPILNGTPANGQVLVYNALTQTWNPSNSTSGAAQTNAFPTTAATVAAGSSNSFVAGGNNNRLSGTFAVVVGGTGNTNGSDYGFIGGGIRNTNIAGSTHGSAIVGGYDNLNMSWGGGFIGAGNNNKINPAEFATIVGGSQNIIASGQASIIAAGQDNYIESEWAAILGGETNRIDLGADWATIGGGFKNRIGSSSGTGTKSFIGGGSMNFCDDDFGIIGAGQENVIMGGGGYSGILGGRANNIAAAKAFIVGSDITNNLGNSVDIGGSQATKATISTTGAVFRTAVTAPSVTSAASVTGTNFVGTGVTASRAAAWDSLKGLISASATLAELNFLSGVTAGVQQQFVDGTNNVAGLRTAFNTVSNNFLSVSSDVANLKTLQFNILSTNGIGFATNGTNITIRGTYVPGANITLTTNSDATISIAGAAASGSGGIATNGGTGFNNTLTNLTLVGTTTNLGTPGTVSKLLFYDTNGVSSLYSGIGSAIYNYSNTLFCLPTNGNGGFASALLMSISQNATQNQSVPFGPGSGITFDAVTRTITANPLGTSLSNALPVFNTSQFATPNTTNVAIKPNVQLTNAYSYNALYFWGTDGVLGSLAQGLTGGDFGLYANSSNRYWLTYTQATDVISLSAARTLFGTNSTNGMTVIGPAGGIAIGATNAPGASNLVVMNSATVWGTAGAQNLVASNQVTSLTAVIGTAANPGNLLVVGTNANPISINSAPQALSYTGSGAAGTNVSVNATNGHMFVLVMTNNVYLTAANMAVGQQLGVILVQGGIGDFKLSFNTNVLRTNTVDGYTLVTNVGGQSYVSILPGAYATNAATAVRKMF